MFLRHAFLPFREPFAGAMMCGEGHRLARTKLDLHDSSGRLTCLFRSNTDSELRFLGDMGFDHLLALFQHP